VAGRYGGQQYLIGPELYPVYVFVLKLVLAIVAASALLTAIVTGIVTNAVNPSQVAPAVRTAVAIFWNGSFSSVGVVTIIFAALQRQNKPLSFLEKWNPRDLPKTPRQRRESWLEHVAAIVVQVIFLLWWAGAIHFGQPFAVLGQGKSLHLDFEPIWLTLYWPILGLSAGVILVHFVKLTKMVGARLGNGLDLVLQIATVVIATIALRAGRWVEIAGSGLPAKAMTDISLGLNVSAQITLVVIIVVANCTGLLALWRLYRPLRPA